MKDEDKRPKGKYVISYEKTVNGIETTVTETTIVGKYFEVLSYQFDYNPPVPVLPLHKGKIISLVK